MTAISGIFFVFTYFLLSVSLPVFFAKEIILTTAITWYFTRLYFKDSKIVPSARHAFLLGGLMIIVPNVLGFVFALFGAPPTINPPPYALLLTLGGSVLVLLSATITGWYLAKK